MPQFPGAPAALVDGSGHGHGAEDDLLAQDTAYDHWLGLDVGENGLLLVGLPRVIVNGVFVNCDGEATGAPLQSNTLLQEADAIGIQALVFLHRLNRETLV